MLNHLCFSFTRKWPQRFLLCNI